MVIDYKKGKIYKITNNVSEEIYIGSTTLKYLSIRFSMHKTGYKRWKNGKTKANCSSYYLYDKYGMNNCNIILIENYSSNSKDELHAREDHYIRSLPNVINKNNAIFNDNKFLDYHKKYRQVNKDLISDKAKNYYETNKDKISDQKKNYYKLNKDKIAKYYEVNKDLISDKAKNYYQANKNLILNKRKIYREDNKELIADKAKNYYEANKENLIKYRKEYYQKNKLENKK